MGFRVLDGFKAVRVLGFRANWATVRGVWALGL